MFGYWPILPAGSQLALIILRAIAVRFVNLIMAGSLISGELGARLSLSARVTINKVS